MNDPLEVGERVWLLDGGEGYVLAQVCSLDGGTAEVARVITSAPGGGGSSPVITPERDALLANKTHSVQLDALLRANPKVLDGLDDMTGLSNLNDASVLYNVKWRFARELIYTYTGPILLAVNPYKSLPDLYNEEQLKIYASMATGRENTLPPHIYAVAQRAFRSLRDERKSQAMIVSGESGAGKTESTKFLCRYLTDACRQQRHGTRARIEEQILRANPLLEAFGNAMTLRNDNSSRFGKWIEIQYDAGGSIVGASIRRFLLETSRVTQQVRGERNYHIFYQLCRGVDERERRDLKLDQPERMQYLCGGATTIPGVDDAAEFAQTVEAMRVVGLDEAEIHGVQRVLAAVIAMGQLEISADDAGNAREVGPSHALMNACWLLEVNVETLQKSLTTKLTRAGSGSTFETRLLAEQAIDARNALARFCYDRLFSWLVDRINSSMSNDAATATHVGILDIFGFEHFDRNGFEQLCINFTNEHLQQHFVQHKFKLEQEEYEAEGVDWSRIDFRDNAECITLLERIFHTMNDSVTFRRRTARPGDTASLLRDEIVGQNGRHPSLSAPPRQPDKFVVHHYAGDVMYSPDDFMVKNADTLHEDLRRLISASRSEFLRGLFRRESSGEDDAGEGTPSRARASVAAGAGARRAKSAATITSKLQADLETLLTKLREAEPHFIRCIKPNSSKSAGEFDGAAVLHQLRCLGVLEAVRISQRGFPNRYLYPDLCSRYWQLVPGKFDWRKQPREAAQALLESSMDATAKASSTVSYALGRTKAFLRAGVIASLERARERVLGVRATVLAAHWRGFLARRAFLVLRARHRAALACGARWRAFVRRRAFVLLRLAAGLAQRHWRGVVGRRAASRLRAKATAATRIAALWRQVRVQRAFQRQRKAVVTVQRRWRGVVARMFVQRIRRQRRMIEAVQHATRTWLAVRWRANAQRAALVLQCAWRRKLAYRARRHALRELDNRRREAVVSLQMGVRTVLAQRRAQALRDEVAKAVTEFQTAWRCRMARRDRREAVRRIQKLQRAARVILARRELAKRRRAKERADRRRAKEAPAQAAPEAAPQALSEQGAPAAAAGVAAPPMPGALPRGNGAVPASAAAPYAAARAGATAAGPGAHSAPGSTMGAPMAGGAGSPFPTAGFGAPGAMHGAGATFGHAHSGTMFPPSTVPAHAASGTPPAGHGGADAVRAAAWPWPGAGVGAPWPGETAAPPASAGATQFPMSIATNGLDASAAHGEGRFQSTGHAAVHEVPPGASAGMMAASTAPGTHFEYAQAHAMTPGAGAGWSAASGNVSWGSPGTPGSPAFVPGGAGAPAGYPGQHTSASPTFGVPHRPSVVSQFRSDEFVLVHTPAQFEHLLAIIDANRGVGVYKISLNGILLEFSEGEWRLNPHGITQRTESATGGGSLAVFELPGGITVRFVGGRWELLRVPRFRALARGFAAARRFLDSTARSVSRALGPDAETSSRAPLPRLSQEASADRKFTVERRSGGLQNISTALKDTFRRGRESAKQMLSSEGDAMDVAVDDTVLSNGVHPFTSAVASAVHVVGSAAVTVPAGVGVDDFEAAVGRAVRKDLCSAIARAMMHGFIVDTGSLLALHERTLWDFVASGADCSHSLSSAIYPVRSLRGPGLDPSCQFRAFVVHGLNSRALHLWLDSLYAMDGHVRAFYSDGALLRSVEHRTMILREIAKLAAVQFSLQLDREIKTPPPMLQQQHGGEHVGARSAHNVRRPSVLTMTASEVEQTQAPFTEDVVDYLESGEPAEGAAGAALEMPSGGGAAGLEYSPAETAAGPDGLHSMPQDGFLDVLVENAPGQPSTKGTGGGDIGYSDS